MEFYNADTSGYDNYNDTTTDRTTDLSEYCDDSILQQLLDEPFENTVDGSKLRTDKLYEGFDNNAGDTWIYPTNLPRRDYQYNICKVALFKNTLVALPTGLGKTFIAAVIMYNFYRWYPRGKVIFMAPTRPLVSQQIEACYKIMGIPPTDTVEMTGKQSPAVRSILWKNKRVFFVTPQVVQSDIFTPDSNFPVNDIKLIVVDEAHKAKGKYAYTEVVQNVWSRNTNFRVLALSATPGRGMDDVAEVVKNLLISHIEVRCETSIDVMPFTHRKNIKSVIIPLGPRLSQIKEDFINILDPYVRNLMDNNVISGNVDSLNKGWLVWQQKKYREMSLVQKHVNHSTICSDFSVCISMYHALELLVRQGVQSFLHFFDDQSNSSEEKYFVAKDRKLKQFLECLRSEVGPNPYLVNDQTLPDGTIADIPDNLDFGHPKFDILQKHLVEHFEEHPQSKVIVFTEFRDTVTFIHRLLLQNRPLIKPRMIVGQGSSSNLRAVTQQEQLAVMKDFRNGVSNTLIATCVVEEGIDVGEVDLIVCFDLNSKNPTRFIQRIGRTGRRRQGKVIILATEGKEQQALKEVLAMKDKINQKIAKSSSILQKFYHKSPRLVPTEFNPKCIETFIKITDNAEPTNEPKQKKTKKDLEPPAKRSRKVITRQTTAASGMQDMRNFFKVVPVSTQTKDEFLVPKIERHLPTPTKNSSSDCNTSSENKENVSDSGSMEMPSLDELLHDATCPVSVKEILLRSDVEYIKNKFLSIVNYLDDVESSNYKQLARDIKAMAVIFGGEAELQEVVDNHNKRMKYGTPFVSQQKNNESIADVTDPDDGEAPVENPEHIFSTQIDLKFFENTQHESRYQDNVISSSYNEGPIQTSINCKPIAHKLLNSADQTPLINKKRKSTTPLTSHCAKKMKDSPLMKAFERSIQKKINYTSTPQKEKIDTPDPDILEMYAFFGITQLEDIFGDDNKVGDEERRNQPSTSRACRASLTFMDKLNGTRAYTETDDVEIILPSQEPIIFIDSDSEEAPPSKVVRENSFMHTTNIAAHSTSQRKDLTSQTSKTNVVNIADVVSEEANISSALEELNLSLPRLCEEINKDRESKTKANETVYTITQIMNIADQQGPSVKKNSPTKLDAFDLGDIEDIFNLSDDDMFKDFSELVEKPAPVQKSPELIMSNKENEIENEYLMRKVSSELFDSKNISALVVEGGASWQLTPKKMIKTASPKVNSSPSYLTRRPNFSRLKQMQAIIPSPVKPSESPVPDFVSCNSAVDSSSFLTNDLDSVVIDTKLSVPANQSRFKFTQPHNTSSEIPATQSQHDVRPLRTRQPKKIFINSSSDSEDFTTCRVEPDMKRVERKTKRTKRSTKMAKCRFLDNEAGVSGNEHSSDEDDEDASFVNDSVFVEENEDEGVDIRAKYLQSIRSPLNKRGAFKIPELKKTFNYEDIFSQAVREDESMVDYKEDSFVIDEDDISESEEELCELEIAEAILKERRRKRRLGLDYIEEPTNYKKKRKKIKVCEPSDDEEDDLKLFRKQFQLDIS